MTTLALARSRLTKLGFNVAPDARHPFGTGNCCVFLKDRTYLEAITILDRGAADMAAAERNIFVRKIKRFTERRGEGFAMVALASDDADADRLAFEKAGIDGGHPVHRFGRKASLSDGSEQEIGFAVAHVDYPAAVDAAFFACQHLAKEVLFQPDYLSHPNGATGLSAIAAVADSPADFRKFLRSAIAQRRFRASPTGLEAKAKGGVRLLVLTQAAFRERYDVDPPNPRRGMIFAALELEVLEIERAASYAGRQAKRRDGRVVVPPGPGLNAVLAFGSTADA